MVLQSLDACGFTSIHDLSIRLRSRDESLDIALTLCVLLLLLWQQLTLHDTSLILCNNLWPMHHVQRVMVYSSSS